MNSRRRSRRTEFPIEDVPLTDPIFRSQFVVTARCRRSRISDSGALDAGGETSERGDDTREPHFRAIRDAHGRIIVVMTHNTDVADSWEREGRRSRVLLSSSRPTGIALGVNVLLHAMTH